MCSSGNSLALPALKQGKLRQPERTVVSWILPMDRRCWLRSAVAVVPSTRAVVTLRERADVLGKAAELVTFSTRRKTASGGVVIDIRVVGPGMMLYILEDWGNVPDTGFDGCAKAESVCLAASCRLTVNVSVGER